MNLYTYTGNNPINYSDPFGLSVTLPSPADFLVCTKVKREHPELWKGKDDKFAHCALACQITKEYGPWAAHNCALWKEVVDKYDRDPTTHFEPEDYQASIEGVRIGMCGGDCIERCKRDKKCP